MIGLVPGTLSVGGAIAVGVLGLAGLIILLFRRGFGSALRENAPRIGADAISVSGTNGAEDRIMRAPRLLFYAGALTVALMSAKPAAGVTISQLFFLAAFGAAVIAVLAGRPVARLPIALVAGVGLFVLGGLISSTGAADPARSVTEVIQGIYVLLLWVWTGATVLRTRRQIMTVLTLWTVSAAFVGFTAITQVVGLDWLAGPLHGNRASGLTDHPNDLGGVCAIALVPALMLATSRFPWQSAPAGSPVRAPRWGILGLIAAGVVLSASVGSMIAGFIAILAWLVAPAVRAPGRIAVITALAFTMLAVMLAGGRVSSPSERVQQVTGSSRPGSTGSTDIRVKTMERALSRVANDPIVGNGMGPAGGGVYIIDQGRTRPYQVHGQPVSIWYQTGIFGFLGVTIVIVTFARAAWRSLTDGDQNDMLIGLAIFGAFIAFVIHAMSTPFYFQQYGWFAGVMLIAWRARRDAFAGVLFTGQRVPAALPA